MEPELARYVARVAFTSSSALNDLVPLLRQHCGDQEYAAYKTALATASATIGIEVLKKIYEEHPDIEKEFERLAKKYGVI